MNLLKEVPEIRDVKTLKRYLRPLYIIEDYMVSYEKYEDFCTEFRNIVRACFVFKECREYPIKFKFYRTDAKSHKLELRHFLINIYSWYPFCELYGIPILTEDVIIHPEDIPHLNDYINEKMIEIMRRYNVNQVRINMNISEVTDKYTSISLDFSDLMNLTFSDKDFFRMYDDPEYRELMDYTSPEGAQPVEIEEKLHSYQDRLIKKIISDKINPLGVIKRAGTGLKDKQLAEFFIAMGMKPTLTGEVMPISIDNSSLIRGLDRASYMYIDATAARKPLVLNATKMGDAGYFGKNINELARTLEMSTKVTFCNTKHLVPYTIRSKKHLKKLIGKYYKISLDADDFYSVKPTDTHLIGQTIYTRSAITCNCSQNKVCPSCIGTNASLLFDIASGVGVYFTEEISKVLEQNILSSKHILTTSSEKIEFTEEFKKYFNIVASDVMLSPEENLSVENLAIFIDQGDVVKVEEYDNDSTYNTYISTGTFKIVDMETGEFTKISIKNDKELYITTDASTIMRDNHGYIPFRDCDPDMPIFAVTIANNELTKPLYDLMHLLDRSAKDFEPTIENVAQKTLDILVEAGIDAPMVAGEMILNRLFRKSDNIMERPDFGRYHVPDYNFYTVTKVLEHNESITSGLSFENLKRQMLSSDLEDRVAPSFLDACFKEKIDMRPLKKYQNSTEKYYLNAH